MSFSLQPISEKDRDILLFLSRQIDFSKACTQRATAYNRAPRKPNSGVVGISKRHHSIDSTVSVFLRKLVKQPYGPFFIYYLIHTVRKMFPAFRFNCIMMNKNFEGTLHVDKQNLGPSVMLTVGEFAGGQLFMRDHFTSSHDVIEVSGQALTFDGAMAHATMPFCGDRYSFVFFDSVLWYRAPMRLPIQEQVLLDLGFCPLTRDEGLQLAQETTRRHPPPVKRIQQAAAAEHQERRVRQARLLGYCNARDCWQLLPETAEPAEGDLREDDSQQVGAVGDRR